MKQAQRLLVCAVLAGLAAGCASPSGGPLLGARPSQTYGTPVAMFAPQAYAMAPVATMAMAPPVYTAAAPMPSIAMASPQMTTHFAAARPISTAQVGPPVHLAALGQTLDGRSVPLLRRASRPGRGRQSNRPHIPHRMALAGGFNPTPGQDLKYRGGKTIRDLTFINLYIGGQNAWAAQDWQSIDHALAAAMADPQLNNVMVQYFGNQAISSRFLGSFFVDGYNPSTVDQTDVERLLKQLHDNGTLKSYDLSNLVVNFLLPRGTILTDANNGQQSATQSSAVIPHEDEYSSLAGLGGYHGSIHAGADTLYYAVGVYSERTPDGRSNGIPVFPQAWKNVVATFYHELQEARTDPDVEDAVRTGQDHFCGWTSDSGEECGDYPVEEAQDLTLVVREVPLSDGSGTVPIQLQYSNAVHGPEGPIPTPHGGPLTGGPSTPPPPYTNPGPSPSSPPTTSDPDLARLNALWPQLTPCVRTSILKIATP